MQLPRAAQTRKEEACGCQRGGEKQAREVKNYKSPLAKHMRHGYEMHSVGNIVNKYVNLWMVTYVVVSHMVTTYHGDHFEMYRNITMLS